MQPVCENRKSTKKKKKVSTIIEFLGIDDVCESDEPGAQPGADEVNHEDSDDTGVETTTDDDVYEEGSEETRIERADEGNDAVSENTTRVEANISFQIVPTEEKNVAQHQDINFYNDEGDGMMTGNAQTIDELGVKQGRKRRSDPTKWNNAKRKYNRGSGGKTLREPSQCKLGCYNNQRGEATRDNE